MFKVEIFKMYRDVFIIEHQLKNLEPIEILKKAIDDSDGSFSYKTSVKGKMTDFNYFVNNETFINIIKECEIFFLALNFKKLYLKEAWGNILEQGQIVNEHDHNPAELSGILYLTEGGPGTYFSDAQKTVEEKIGKIVFFDSRMKHSVPSNNYPLKRYTLAFNFFELKPW
jgi:hypothetical protein